MYTTSKKIQASVKFNVHMKNKYLSSFYICEERSMSGVYSLGRGHIGQSRQFGRGPKVPRAHENKRPLRGSVCDSEVRNYMEWIW